MFNALKIKLFHAIAQNTVNEKLEDRNKERIRKIINSMLSLPDGEEKIEVVQNLIFSTNISRDYFPPDFDITPYLLSDNLKIRLRNIKLDKLKKLIDKYEIRDSYKSSILFNNVPYEVLDELVNEEPSVMVYVSGENSRKLYAKYGNRIDPSYVGHLASVYNINYLYSSNKELFMKALKAYPEVLSTIKGIDDQDIDNYILSNGNATPELLYYYCGNNPQVLELKSRIVKDNYVEFFKNTLAYNEYDKQYELDKGFIVNAFREMFKENPETMFNIEHQRFFSKKELYDVFKDYEFTYEQLKKWFTNNRVSMEKGSNYSEFFKKYLYKDPRFFEFVSVYYEDDPKLFNYAYNLLKKDFNNIQYINLKTIDSAIIDSRINHLIAANMEKYKEHMQYMQKYFLNPIVLRKFRELIDKDITLLKYFELDTEDYWNKKLVKEIKAIEKTIIKKLKETPTMYTYYNGGNRKILDLIIENTGNLTLEQLKKYNCTIDEYRAENSKIQKVLLKAISKINPNLSIEEVRNLLDYLLSNNDEILKTADLELLNEQYYPLFVIDNNIQRNIIKIIFRYPKLQKSIINIMNTLQDKQLFKMLFQFIMLNHPNNLSLLETIINTLKEDKRLYDLGTSAINKYPDKKDILLFNISYLLTKKIKIISITNEEEILNIEQIIDTKCKEIINNPNSDLSIIKEAFLLEKLGIPLKDATRLIEIYGNMDKEEPNLTEEEIKLLDILEVLSMIVNCDNKEKLTIIYNSINKSTEIRIDESFVLEQKLRQMNARHLNQALTSVEDMKDTHLEDKYGVKIYEALDENNPHEFQMLVTSLGAYSSTEVPKNYREDWLRPKEESHGFCTSLISSQMLGVARIKHCVLGFQNIPLDNLLLSAPYDIGSNTEVLDVINYNRRVQFFFPKKMIDNTRHTHNELVIERLDGDKKIYPSFVVFVVEHFNPDGQYKKEEQELWNHTLQAARDLNIPIVVVDRSKIKQYQKRVINSELEEFKKAEPNCHLIIKRIITRMINMCTGLNNSNLWNKTGFTYEDLYSLTDEIIAIIMNMINDNKVEQGIICFKELLSTIEEEDKKSSEFNMSPFTEKINKSLQIIRDKVQGNAHHQALVEQLGVEYNGKKL